METIMKIILNPIRWMGILGLATIIGVAIIASHTIAFAEGRIVVYNATNPKLASKVIRAFKQRNPGIEVDVINAGVGELFTRIAAEKINPLGDVLIGASVEAYDSAVDLFAPYKSKEDHNFERNVVAAGYQYYGFSMPLQAFIVNRKLMPGNTGPKSWADLGKPEFNGKIIMANPALSGSAYAQLAQMLQLHGWALVKKVVKNTTFVTSSKLVYQNVAKGEIAVGITGDYNVIKMRDKGYSVDAVYPGEGTGLRFDANGLIKGGPNPGNGKVFLDFANSREAHEIMVSLRNRRSVRKDVTAPKGQIPTADVPTFPYNAKKAASDRKANIAKFDDIFNSK